MKAKLKFPILGCVEIRLVEKREFKWLAELIGVGMHIEVFEDEFVLEKQGPDGLVLSFSDTIEAN